MTISNEEIRVFLQSPGVVEQVSKCPERFVTTENNRTAESALILCVQGADDYVSGIKRQVNLEDRE